MILLFDIGGTKIRLTGSDDGQSFGEPVIFPTPTGYDEAISAITTRALDLAAGKSIEKVAGGIRAYDRITGHMREHANFPLWSGQDIRASIERAFQVEAKIENDSALVALGEATAGAGKGKNIVAYLTISTGVGGARIVGGKIDANAYGFEPGHQIIDGSNSLENLISGTAVEKKYKCPPHEIGDEAIWNELAHYLALGLNNIIVHWSPDIVVLGGSMMNEVGIPIAATTAHLEKILTVYGVVPPIVHAALREQGGLHGALALAQST